MHQPGDGKWDDKASFKSVNSICKVLRNAVTEELFRYMTLEYSYDYDFEAEKWMVPRLVSFTDDQPQLAQHDKAIRLVIVPILIEIGVYHGLEIDTCLHVPPGQEYSAVMRKHSELHFPAWAWHVMRRLVHHTGVSNHICSPCVIQNDEIHSNVLTPVRGLDYAFDRLFGKSRYCEGDTSGPTDELLDIESGKKRTIFATYILQTMLQLLNTLPKVERLEAGVFPRLDEHWPMMQYEYTAVYRLAFASATIMKSLPPKISSLRFHSIPLARQATGQVAIFSTDYIQMQTKTYTGQLTNLDLDICNIKLFPTSRPFGESQTSPADTMTYWSTVLQPLLKLRSLRLTDSRRNRQHRNEKELLLDILLADLKLPDLRVLHLAMWSVSLSTIVERIPACFPVLKVLDLEKLDMRSEEKDPWPMALGLLVKQYEHIEISLNGLRQRLVRGETVGRLQKAVKGQFDDVWDRVENKE